MDQIKAWEYFVRGMGGDVLAFHILLKTGAPIWLAASAARYLGTRT